MLLVLPPSRGQTPGPPGAAPVQLDSLALPSLTEARTRLVSALAGTEHDPVTRPTAPAHTVFTGVLFAAADLPGAVRSRGAAARRVREDVVIASPLLGMVTPTDAIPASRLAMGSVPGIGSLGSFWRPALTEALAHRPSQELVVDVRSSEFLPLWRPAPTADWVQVRVEEEVDGERRVVSHAAKHLRGVLVGHLLRRRGAEPTDARSLLQAARGLRTSGAIKAAELQHSPRSGTPAVLTLVC
ncbi:YaaA family protein [Serinibacter salmoneus]|uniref:Peroxide stress protein YaaA n=1 Tax=Serinibacter salmoneus TaxID=556530 RepID=A0A2A9CYJ9_9MICO|nr:peroxide stress protein YaaA [Serinibacter salmoneus]PFG19473.1 hypothetical protein ATL40_1036 [Serinibacter salmoneus]